MKNLPALLKKISRLRILVFGDVMLDRYIWGDATRISPEAPVPVIDVDRETWTAGGAGNVALNIASLGARCTVAGYFGNDEAGRKLATALNDRKISTLSTPGDIITEIGSASGYRRSYSSFGMSSVMKHHSASDPHGSWIIGSIYTLKLLRTRPIFRSWSNESSRQYSVRIRI